MAVTFNDYLNVVRNTNKRIPKVKVEFLRYEDETVREVVTGYLTNSNGVLNVVNKNGTRRTASFELVNKDNKFSPNTESFELRQKIRISSGLEINGEDYLFGQGIFIIKDPNSTSNYSDKRMSISCVDKFSLADGTLGGEVEGIYIIPAGTSIPTAIRSILQPSTDVQKEVFFDPIEPLIDTIFDSEVTPYTIELAEGDKISSILLQLADMMSANIYYDVEGRLIFEQDVSDRIKPSLHDFEDGDFNYMGDTQSFLNSMVYNAVLVIGANINGDIAKSYIENNDLQSETSIPNVGWKRVKYVSDPNISTDLLASYRSKYELKKVTKLQSEHSIETVPMYHLTEDGIVTLTESHFGLTKQRNIINSYSLPLATNGNMSISFARSTELLFD